MMRFRQVLSHTDETYNPHEGVDQIADEDIGVLPPRRVPPVWTREQQHWDGD